MADIWSQATGGALHSGSWSLFGVPLPDLGVTEAAAAGKTNSQGGSNLVPDNIQNAAASAVPIPGLNLKAPGAVQGANTQASGGGGGGSWGSTTTTNNNTNNDRYNELKKIAEKGDLNPSQKTEWEKMQEEIKKASQSSEDAARAAAEARRQAAYRAYEAKKGIAGQAKESAKGQYDWLVETLGSQKKDLLDEVSLNEKTGVAEYERQDVKTQENYDKARKEILGTYRDLAKEQEKILRGAGVAQSSRSVEAQLRLNNLLGKDMSEVSTNEADALSMIGNALATFKERVQLTKNSIETEAKTQESKAALDYNNQIKAIDMNLQLDANAREDAIAAADVQLAQDTAEIQKWAAGLKLQVEMTIAQQAGEFDDFIADMTDSTKLLDSDLATKQAATDEFVNQISTAVTLDKEGNLVNPSSGGARTKVKSLASVYDPNKVGLAGVGQSTAAPSQQTGTVQNLSSRDPLAQAIA